jgi:two-component system, OmpR family, osmolarity sensor histidine kinase EnvZ
MATSEAAPQGSTTPNPWQGMESNPVSRVSSVWPTTIAQTAPGASDSVPGSGLSLFWRTFVLLALLLGGGLFAWMQTLRWLEFEPRAVQASQQIASLVNLSTAALRYSDSINRVALTKTMSDQESVRMLPRAAGDRFEPFEVDRFTRMIGNELRTRLGPETLVAKSVNGTPGLWVSLVIDKDPYWLHADAERVATLANRTWFTWASIALGATLLGAAAIARLINQPLRDLSFAATRIREGAFDSRLDENTLTSEIREVNIGFNRMARELAKVEEDRAVMLAGISHDLRTPLARLRLEAEMSVADEEARRYMASDIDQLDAIIDKFMDYARPGVAQLSPVALGPLVQREASAYRDPAEIRIHANLPADLVVMADDTELGRVFANLFENARRYGRTGDTGVAMVEVSAVRTGPWIIVAVRDHGPGVSPEKLPQLTTPFYRGDAARTAATGAGLGLAIVDKSIQRMGGKFEFANARDGGMVFHVRLKRLETADVDSMT